jgi:hypothetical protein
MTNELEEYIRQIKLRREVIKRNLEIVLNRTREFGVDSSDAIGEISIDEWKEAIKRIFCEEINKL